VYCYILCTFCIRLPIVISTSNRLCAHAAPASSGVGTPGPLDKYPSFPFCSLPLPISPLPFPYLFASFPSLPFLLPYSQPFPPPSLPPSPLITAKGLGERYSCPSWSARSPLPNVFWCNSQPKKSAYLLNYFIVLACNSGAAWTLSTLPLRFYATAGVYFPPN